MIAFARTVLGFTVAGTVSLASAAVLVTELKGTAAIADLGAAALLTEIPEGARVVLSPGARMTVVDLTSGKEYAMTLPGKYQMRADGVYAPDGTPVNAAPLPLADLPKVSIDLRKVAQATLVMRGLQPVNTPLPVSPVRTAVLSATPTLQWNAVKNATRYLVTVSTPGGAERWKTESTATVLPWGSSEALEPGQRYQWSVQAFDDQGRVSGATAEFSVIDTEAATRLVRLRAEAGDPLARRVLYAAQLQEAGAVEEAKRQWRALAAENPQDKVIAQLAK